jgi:tetratricopeptide (TPR) repeat protein
MTPKPAIPEEAERYMARGAAAVKGAKTEKDFQDAALEFEKASLAAPWLAAAYYNLGITQDKAGKYKEAIQSLKLYLLAAPEASDAKAVKTLVYEIEYRQEKAAKESSPEAVAAKKEKEQQDFLKKINGARYIFHQYDVNEDTDWKLVVLGDEIIQNKCFIRSDFQDAQKSVGRCYHFFTFKIDGRRLQCTSRADLTGVISDDGNTITLNYKGGVTVYKRER